MKINTKPILEAINSLIESLEKTKNSTAPFFKEAVNKIENHKSQEELKKLLIDYSIVGSGKIADFGAFNREQCDLATNMHNTAYEVYKLL
jgi:hypothetical protein